MPDLAVAVVHASRNIMSNLTEDPIDAFRLVASQAQGMLNYFQGPRMVIAPEYFLNRRLATDANVPAAMQRSQKHKTYKTLEQISGGLGNTILIAGTIFYTKRLRRRGLSVCPVLQNGQIIYKYYKMFDDGALGKNYRKATFEIKDTSPIFTSDGITFGIEVCGDRSMTPPNRGTGRGSGTRAASTCTC